MAHIERASIENSSRIISIFCFCFCTIIISTCLTFTPWLVHSTTLESDKEALHSLVQAMDPTSIPAYSFIHTWDFQKDPCESSGDLFLGILCTIPLENSSSRVTTIDLDSAGYDGFLPPELGNLTELSILSLRDNKFRGAIPGTICNLRKLTVLSLAENVFSGFIPDGIGRLTMLEIIDLSSNTLSGRIPGGISGMGSLTHLKLSHNRLSGTIPGLAGQRHLNALDLSNNRHSGTMPRLPSSLRTLSLSRNALRGPVSSVRSLERLRTLDLSNNRFSGPITGEILTLPQLARVDVSMNRFRTLEVANFIDRPTQLQVLDAHKNSLRGWLPQNLVTLQNLTSINLGHNQFNGRIPKAYGPKIATSWISVFLDYNFLVGSLPPKFRSSHSKGNFSGSLAHNCLRCPRTAQLCHGGQRPTSSCDRARQLEDGETHSRTGT